MSHSCFTWRPFTSAPAPAGGFGRGWMQEFGTPALARLLPLLHHTSRCLLATLDGPAPGGLLVCGPPGSGTMSPTLS